MAEYRPALTEFGALGTEVEIFLYDTLSGGAGFSTQLAGRAAELFRNTLGILSNCPHGCDASCYRCLRSFRNKLDHRFLDRKIGEQLLRAALEGGYPEYPVDRTQGSLNVLFNDLTRQLSTDFQFERNSDRTAKDGSRVCVPILAIRRTDQKELWISLASPVAPEVSVDPVLRQIVGWPTHPVFSIDELMVRTNLPAAVNMIVDQFRQV